MTQEERFGGSPDMMPWVNELIDAGKYIMGSPFEIAGQYVSQHGNTASGAFIKDTAGLSGFDIICAEDLEEATAIASRCPMVLIGHAIREVRPLVDLPE